MCAISTDVIDKLGIKSRRGGEHVSVQTPSGRTQALLYSVGLIIPEAKLSVPSLHVVEMRNLPVPFLLGMDILQQGAFTLDREDVFTFCV